MGLLFCLWDESTCSRVSLPIPSVMSLPVMGLLFLFCPRSSLPVMGYCFVCGLSLSFGSTLSVLSVGEA